ncbi:MAG: hypothetical protein U0353_30820 [Sandaracinus sp.]
MLEVDPGALGREGRAHTQPRVGDEAEQRPDLVGESREDVRDDLGLEQRPHLVVGQFREVLRESRDGDVELLLRELEDLAERGEHPVRGGHLDELGLDHRVEVGLERHQLRALERPDRPPVVQARVDVVLEVAFDRIDVARRAAVAPALPEHHLRGDDLQAVRTNRDLLPSPPGHEGDGRGLSFATSAATERSADSLAARRLEVDPPASVLVAGSVDDADLPDRRVRPDGEVDMEPWGGLSLSSHRITCSRENHFLPLVVVLPDGG